MNRSCCIAKRDTNENQCEHNSSYFCCCCCVLLCVSFSLLFVFCHSFCFRRGNANKKNHKRNEMYEWKILFKFMHGINVGTASPLSAAVFWGAAAFLCVYFFVHSFVLLDGDMDTLSTFFCCCHLCICVCVLAPQIRYATRAFQLPLVHRNYTEMSTQSPAVAACAKWAVSL